MRQLRELGIYKTPDGRAHVVRAGLLGSYLLFRLGRCAEGFPTYVVDLAGRVVTPTQPTPWLSEELFDTGRTFHEVLATPRKTAGVTPPCDFKRVVVFSRGLNAHGWAELHK